MGRMGSLCEAALMLPEDDKHSLDRKAYEVLSPIR